MLSKICRLLTVGAVAALGLCLPAAADVVFDDFEDGSTQNAYGGYWYTYESGYSPKINLPEFAIADGAGTMNLAGMGGSGENQEVAIGTDLKKEGMGSDWNGLQSISFRAKGPNGLAFNFYLNTLENDATPSNWNKHGKKLAISGNGWNTYTVNLSTDLSQNPGGTAANDGAKFTFDKTKVTKLAWSIKKAENAGVTSGTFAIDDITLIGDVTAPTTPVTPPSTGDLCNSCVSATFGPSAPSVLLADFESTKNALGYYGYPYNGPHSTAEIERIGREGNGLSIEFTINETKAEDRYAGIGINLSDDKVVAPLDASTFTGIYLEYKTTGITVAKVEVVDKVGALNPEGKDFYINLPGTNGVWMSAVVNFSALVVPSWVTPKPTFNKSNLAKIQISSNVNGSGTIAVDNVYFLGDTKFPGQITPAAYTLTYKANTTTGGSVKVDGTEYVVPYVEAVTAGERGPLVTAVPSANHRFVMWDDGETAISRYDIATSDKVFTAIFDLQTYTVTYVAGDNGDLLVDGELKKEHTVTLLVGQNGPEVTAVGQVSPPYQFARWDDGVTTASRSGDKVTNGNLTFTAAFEPYVEPSTPVKVTYTAGEGGSLLLEAPVITVECDISNLAGCVQAINEDYYGRGTVERDNDLLKKYSVDLLKSGAYITMEAVPSSGYKFGYWNDNNSTEASRTDRYEDGPVNAVAVFIPIVTTDPDVEQFVLSYSVSGTGGSVRIKAESDNANSPAVTRVVESGKAGPEIIAVPDDGYRFVKWSDGQTNDVRTDVANADLTVTAEFAAIVTSSGPYKVTFIAGTGGSLRIDNATVYSPRYDTTVTAGTSAAVITAIAEAGYKFVKWSSGSTDVMRFNTNILANISDTAIFQLRDAVASPSREIPKAPTTEITAVAPVTIIAGELTFGPNPTSVSVNIFRTGRAIKAGKLSVYDASGNVVTKISINDKGNNGKRVIGTWNLKDSKGKHVAIGSYAIKGTITTKDGTKEKVSTIIAVTK